MERNARTHSKNGKTSVWGKGSLPDFERFQLEKCVTFQGIILLMSPSLSAPPTP
jgi:hypothetical protein